MITPLPLLGAKDYCVIAELGRPRTISGIEDVPEISNLAGLLLIQNADPALLVTAQIR